jgi:L-threonylcarbamoyladenylate synthase
MNKLDLSSHAFGTIVKKTVVCLRAGGVIVAPTETVYGLMTCWANAAGRERIYQLKARDTNKRLQMLAEDAGSAATAGQVFSDGRLSALVKAFCPGPLTIVTPGPCGSVGLRVPDCPFILAVLKELGEPLAATSANLSGTPAALTAEAAVVNLQGVPDLVIDGGEVKGGTASTVVSLLQGDVALLREGPVTFKDILVVLS